MDSTITPVAFSLQLCGCRITLRSIARIRRSYRATRVVRPDVWQRWTCGSCGLRRGYRHASFPTAVQPTGRPQATATGVFFGPGHNRSSACNVSRRGLCSPFVFGRLRCNILLTSDTSSLFLDMRRDVQEIFRATPHHKQVMMFSATLAKEIRVTCKKFMANVSFTQTSQ